MSLDGRITRGDTAGTSGWASAEDQQVFRNLIASHDCLVMGSITYRTARHMIRPNADKPRIVLTKNPAEFADDAKRPGLIFTNSSAQEVADEAQAQGCKKMLLVGGGETNARFLDACLVDELCITIEPLLFGSGLPLTAGLHTPTNLKLIACKQLNAQGTLLLHYQVTQPDKDVRYENSQI